MANDKTHCVTVIEAGKTMYAVKPRRPEFRGVIYDAIPQVISPPEPKCAMSKTEAIALANFLKTTSFSSVKVHKLNIKK